MFSLQRGRLVRLSLAGVVILAVAFSCAAQTSRVAGAIQGSVVDQTGSAVASAIATLRNQGTNQIRTTFHTTVTYRRKNGQWQFQKLEEHR